MMDALAGTFAGAAALLLVVSGGAKLRHPGTAAMLVLRLVHRRARMRRGHAVAMVRGIGLGELAVGVAALITGARPALALLAAAYLAFAAVTLEVLRRPGDGTSCGCFGSVDSPLGPAHLVLNGTACAAGIAAVLRPPGPGAGLLDGSAATSATAVLQAALLATLGYLAITSLPALLAARRPLGPSARATQELP